MSVSNEERKNKLEKRQIKHSYFLPTYSAVSSEHPPLFSSEVNERTRTLSLRCLLVLKYALEVESDSSAPEDTGRKKRYLNTEACIKPQVWITRHAPSTQGRRNLKTQQLTAILDLCLRKTSAGKSHNYRDVIAFEKLRFQNFFPSSRKRKGGVSNFLRFEERF